MNPLFAALIDPITGLLEKVIPDVDKRRELAHEIATLAEKQAHEQTMAQIEVNKQEAAHRSIFVAGWRPFIGWTCGIGLFYNVVANPIVSIFYTLPAIDPDLLYPTMFGILGIGGVNVVARTYEKYKGVAK